VARKAVTRRKTSEANAGKPFPSYARLLQQRGKPEGDSRYSWTVDFAARRAQARTEMRPLLDGPHTSKRPWWM
jgi:type I restriction enzyme M protein